MTPVVGLVDSGADYTAMPLDYAAELGYRRKDLRIDRVQQVRGFVPAWRVSKPCTAVVRGISEIRFDICPVFMDGSLNTVWGRIDFMTAYAVELHERQHSFTLTPLLPENGEHGAGEPLALNR